MQHNTGDFGLIGVLGRSTEEPQVCHQVFLGM
jgi:hypothetical protein